MNKEKMRMLVQSIDDDKKINFFVMGEKASSRFDYDKKVELEKVSDENIIAYELYALIADCIFYKAKRKDEGKKGEIVIKSYFQKVLNNSPEEFKDNVNNEIIKAEVVLKDFIFGLKCVDVSTLLATFFPIIVIDFANNGNNLDKKIIQEAKKNRERIFDISLLSIRSLFRCFLTILPINDNCELKIDVDNILNGVFVLKDTLYIPTNRNAFSLRDFKTVVLEGLERLSNNFSLKEINNISVIYFVKDTIANYKIEI